MLEPVLVGVALFVALVVAVPSVVLGLECVVGALARVRCRLARRPGASVVVLVPAHDEEAVIGDAVRALLPELGPRDRLVVVADNCADDTAARAREAGAEVLERRDPTRRGKGYVLPFAVRALAASPPDVLLVVDADCRLAPGAVATLGAHALATGRPVQADYVHAPADDGPRSAVSGFAFLVKNRVRPRGLAALGLPTQLTGAGEAFPWALVADAPEGALGGGALAEDYHAGAELGLRGAPPLPCVCTRCTSVLPDQPAAATTQRRRWEHGHLRLMRSHGGRLLLAGLARGRLDLLAQALDLLVPPVTLLVALQALALALTGAVALGAGAALPLAVAAAATLVAWLGLGLAWWRSGREVLPARVLAAVPAYLAWKVPMLVAFVAGRGETRYGRTARAAVLLGARPQPAPLVARLEPALEGAGLLDAHSLTPEQVAWLDAQAQAAGGRGVVIRQLIEEAMARPAA